jgi:hypothetical protein
VQVELLPQSGIQIPFLEVDSEFGESVCRSYCDHGQIVSATDSRPKFKYRL